MNRRHFLSLSALSAFAPLAPGYSARLVRPSDPMSYLQAFCSTSEVGSLSWLTAPFPMAGHVAASDRRILIRIPSAPTGSVVCPFNEADFAPFSRTWREPFRILPVPSFPEWQECSACQKTGPQMNGATWGDEGFCWACENLGIQTKLVGELLTVPVSSAQRYFSTRFIRKILALPGPVTFALPEMELMPSGDYWPLRFTWCYGDGLVMPLKNCALVRDDCRYQYQTEPA